MVNKVCRLDIHVLGDEVIVAPGHTTACVYLNVFTLTQWHSFRYGVIMHTSLWNLTQDT